MTLAHLTTALLACGASSGIVAVFGHWLGLRRRTCRKLWIAADVLFIAGNAPFLPDTGAAVLCAIWAFNLVLDVRALRRGDDDDDDRPPRRRKRLKLRLPDLSGLVLPGALSPARGAA